MSTATRSTGGGERWSVRLEKQYFNFCSAHFLVFADGTREELHGHNYRVSVVLEGPLRPEGVVFDFLDVKPVVKAICDRIDHRTLLPRGNEHVAVREVDDGRALEIRYAEDRFVIPRRDVVVLDIPNISVEYLARWLAERILEEMTAAKPDARPDAIEVEVEESPGQSAIYRKALP